MPIEQTNGTQIIVTGIMWGNRGYYPCTGPIHMPGDGYRATELVVIGTTNVCLGL